MPISRGAVTNSGTITSGGGAASVDHAVKVSCGTSNRLIITPGAVFDGYVTFKPGVCSTLELAKGAMSAGTLAGLGTTILGVSTIAFADGETITGFIGGSFDITNFAGTRSSGAFGPVQCRLHRTNQCPT